MARYQNKAGHPDSTGRRVQKAKRAKRMAKVSTMIIERKTYEEMAADLGISRRQVIRYAKELMGSWAEEHFPEDRHRWRLQELMRLSAMENAITPIILNQWEVTEESVELTRFSTEAQLKAVGRGLQIMQRRAALLGLDLPREGEADSPTQIGKVIIHVHDDHKDEVLPPPLITKGGNGDEPDGELVEGEFESYHYDLDLEEYAEDEEDDDSDD